MSNLSPTVFISHSSKDDSITRNIEEWLRLLDFECWVYYRDNQIDFRETIQVKIESQCFFLLICSENSLKSDEVKIEIYTAFDAKRRFCIYKLDDYPFPKGIDMTLKGIKWIDARNHTATAFANLAEQMLVAIGLDDDTTAQRISKIKSIINTQQEEEAKMKKMQLEKWLDKLWTYRYDYELKRTRSLNAWDKRKLRRHGDELGISEGDRIRLLRQYKRDLRSFKTAVSKALSSNRLNKRDIKELEQARLECCIPLKEAKCLVRAELSKYSEIITLTKGAAVQDSWIISIVKELIEGSTTRLAGSDSGISGLIEADVVASFPHNATGKEISVQCIDDDQCTANAYDRNQLPQVHRSPKDHAEANRERTKRILEIKAKCHLQWTINEKTIGRCWLRRIEMHADCLYFWGFGRDHSLLLQDIQSIEVNGSTMEVQLHDDSPNVEIDCFGDESLTIDLARYFSDRGIHIVYSLDKACRSGQDTISNEMLREEYCDCGESRQSEADAEMLENGSSAMPDLSPLANGLEADLAKAKVARILDAFRDADAGLFKTQSYYAEREAARVRTLRNHGLQKSSVHDIYLFINTSLFRAKNGILVCDSLLSIKDFFEKPVHFELFTPLSGALILNAKVTDATKISLTVKRETFQAIGRIETRSIQAFNLETSNSLLRRPFYKDLVEQELPALVRNLGLIQKLRLEVD